MVVSCNMAPKAVKKEESRSPDWDFDPRDVTFTISLRATFNPLVKDAVVTAKWPDINGQPAPLSFGPLSSLEADTSPQLTASPKPGQRSVVAVKEIGTFPLNLAFVESLRTGKMSISIKLKPEGVEQNKTAQLHLGPLLMSGGSSEPFGRSLEKSLKRTTRFLGSKVVANCSDDLKVAGLYQLEVQVSTNISVLSTPMLEKLMPACFTVEAVRGLPNEPWLTKSCEEVFLEVYPRTSPTTMSLATACPRALSGPKPHDALIRFSEPVVWFLGTAPLHAVRDWLQHDGIVVEVHDRNPSGSGLQTAAQVPHGVANFQLSPLLEPIALEIALSADVFPARGDKKKRRAEAMKGDALKAEGLLDEEGRALIARKLAAGLDKREDTIGYHGVGTVCSARVALAMPLPQASAIQTREEEAQFQRFATEEVKQGDTNVWRASGQVQPYRAKLAGAVVGPWRRTLAQAVEDEQQLLAAGAAAKAKLQGTSAAVDPATLAKAEAEAMQNLASDLTSNGKEGFDLRYERYSRLVYIAEDTDLPSVQAVLNAVKRHNAKVLGIDADSAELVLHQFSKEQREDPHLDILTGFAVLDKNVSRVIVVEGLREREGLKTLLKAAPRGLEHPDYDETMFEQQGTPAKRRRQPLRLLHNPSIGFAERLYLDFGPCLKSIKIRMPLEKLATQPELYIWSVAQTKETLAAAHAPKLLLGLKQAQRVGFLRQGAPFPAPEHLVNLEILYGDYVTDEELAGFPPPMAKPRPSSNATRKTCHGSESTFQAAEFLSQAVTDKGLQTMKTAAERALRAPTNMDNHAYEDALAMRRSCSVPNFVSANRAVVKQKSEENTKRNDFLGKKRQREGPFQEGQQVFNYSTQRLNSTEIQKAWMREKMDPQQKTKMWSYNEAYLSQSFDFSGAVPPGKREHEPSCPNDTYANLSGDNRLAWRVTQARKPEVLRKMSIELSEGRIEELKTAFVENEWNLIASGDERHRPVAEHVTFNLNKTPHLTRTIEQPFHPALAKPNPIGYFGNPTDLESVHYHGREPGESRGAEAAAHNMKLRGSQGAFLGASQLKTFSKSSRTCITDLDRTEPVLKDVPAMQLRGDIDKRAPSSIRIYEPYHDLGRPDKEWHARLRENDGSPPYDVGAGAYIRRLPENEIATKLGCTAGTLGKAPWSHGSHGATVVKAASLTGRGLTASHAYPAAQDFRNKKLDPDKLSIVKNATRTPISSVERSSSLQYLRPKHYGVELAELRR